MLSWQSSSYFPLLLNEIGCSHITFSEFDWQKQAIGFDCKSKVLVMELLKKLNLRYGVYNRDEHYILTVTNAELDRLMRQHLENVFNQWQDTYQKYNGKYGNFNFTFDIKEDYEHLKFTSYLLKAVRAIGLDYGESTDLDYIPLPSFSPNYGHNFYMRETWQGYLVITDMEKLFAAHGKKIALEVRDSVNEMSKVSFLMGLHPRVGRDSSLRHLQDSPLFERKLVPLLFSYSEMQKEPSEEKRLPERKLDDKIPAIDAAIAILDREIKHPFYWFNIDRKRQKVSFLKLILALKKANPALSTKECVEFAAKENKGLYQEAVKGCFSNRTSQLIETLKSDLHNPSFSLRG